MTLLVPFDGSDLAEAALVRASEFATVLEEDVLVVTVVPAENARYARERGWIDEREDFDLAAIVSTLRRRVTELSPSAAFRHEVVDRYATAGSIAKRVRKIARAEGASMVFVGSENAGHMVTGLGSVGGSVAADENYDVVIVRRRMPATLAALHEDSPHRESKSDFYDPV